MYNKKNYTITAIVGRTNVGKSSLLNLLSGQKEYAITDSAPGTTADTVVTEMEIHDMGPFKILDTAGVDEYSKLGDKKRKKTHEAIEEADLSLIVTDLMQAQKNTSIELELVSRVQKNEKQGLVVYNVFDKNITPTEIEEYKRVADKKLCNKLPSIALNATDRSYQKNLVNFIQDYYQKESRHIDLLPNIKKDGYVLMVIPMDEETPTLRLLKPQDMAVEKLLRNFVTPVLFRPDLKKARSGNSKIVEKEKQRFLNVVKDMQNVELVITDSQAFDVIADWVPEKIPFTSFSVMMSNYMSFGNLDVLIDGVKTASQLKSGDKVLIAESCNHNRKCDDIGTVQIPRLLEKKIGGKLDFNFNFGRPFTDDISRYKLIIHCGACMTDRQKFARRLKMAEAAKIPFTNYGMLLAYLKDERVLERVTKVFEKLIP